MSGVMLDLMPVAIRRRAQAGQRLRRLIAIGVITSGLLITFATHSQLRRDRLEESLLVSESRAAQALQLERQAADLGVVRKEIEDAMQAYDRRCPLWRWPTASADTWTSHDTPGSIRLFNRVTSEDHLRSRALRFLFSSSFVLASIC